MCNSLICLSFARCDYRVHGFWYRLLVITETWRRGVGVRIFLFDRLILECSDAPVYNSTMNFLLLLLLFLGKIRVCYCQNDFNNCRDDFRLKLLDMWWRSFHPRRLSIDEIIDLLRLLVCLPFLEHARFSDLRDLVADSFTSVLWDKCKNRAIVSDLVFKVLGKLVQPRWRPIKFS